MSLSKDYSRNNFTAPDTWETVKIGALQRIADATELMAKNHSSLIDERDRYKKWYEEGRENRDHLYRRIAALKGVITKMKKRSIKRKETNHGKR